MKASPISQPKPQTDSPSTLSHDERHWQLFKASLQGLLAETKFRTPNPDGGVWHLDTKDELQLLKHIAFLAYNAASFACQVYQDDEVEEFTKKV
jgi:hypothetical protein